MCVVAKNRSSEIQRDNAILGASALWVITDINTILRAEISGNYAFLNPIFLSVNAGIYTI